MSESRHLVRLSNDPPQSPSEHALLLQHLRTLAAPYGAAVVNLRLTRPALEFDGFLADRGRSKALRQGFGAWRPVLSYRRLAEVSGPVDPATCVAEARQLFNEERFWE